MNERFMAGVVLFFFFFCFGVLLRQELKNKATEQRLTLISIELEDLKKKERITAQDVVFLEKLVNEGK